MTKTKTTPSLVFNANKGSSFVQRWRSLEASASSIDFEKAKLVAEVRASFPAGTSGHSQARSWIIKHFGVPYRTADALLDSARALRVVPTLDGWTKVGGWRSVAFLLGLKKGDRTRLIKAVNKKAEDSPNGSVSLTTVRKMAFGMNIRTVRKGGRPTQTKAEEKVFVLRNFLASLYKDFEGLPTMPASVRDAMTPTLLAEIRAAISQ